MIRRTKAFKDGKAFEVSVDTEHRGQTMTLEQQAENDLNQTTKENRQSIERMKEQPNVSTIQDGVQTSSGDFFDKCFAEYFECYGVPGFDSLFSDERFPRKNGELMVVSRCYHYKVNDKFVLVDIFDADEDGKCTTPETEILEAKAVFNAIGFLYAWFVKGEETDLKMVFETRMNAKVKAVRLPVQKQTNVETIKNS